MLLTVCSVQVVAVRPSAVAMGPTDPGTTMSRLLIVWAHMRFCVSFHAEL